MDNSPRSGKKSEQDQPPGAERFWGQFAEASARGGSEEKPEPPPGPGPDDQANAEGRDRGRSHECLEWCPVCRSAELLRGAATPELTQQLTALQHEAAGIFKAFIQAYGERAGEDPFASAHPDDPGEESQPVDESPRVTDIRID